MAEQKWRLIGSFFGRTAEAIMITDAGARIVYVNQSRRWRPRRAQHV